MFKKILFAAVFLGNTLLFGQTGRVKGKLIDLETNEEVMFANVKLLREGVVVAKTVSDLEGNFLLKDVAPGSYDLKAASVGYESTLRSGLIVIADGTTEEILKMAGAAVLTCPIIISICPKPLLGMNIRCCRCSSYEYFIDGVRVDSLPVCSDSAVQAVVQDTAKIAESEKSAPQIANSRIYPNPFLEIATLEIASELAIEKGNVKLFDLSGNEIRSQDFSGSTVVIERKGIAPGTYLYEVSSKDLSITAGRLVVQ